MVLQWTLGYMCLFQFWFPQDVCPVVGLLGHMVILFPVFQGISTLFSIVAVQVCIPTNSVRWFPFLHNLSSSPAFIALQHLLFVDFFMTAILTCEMIPHRGFDLHFCNNEWYGTTCEILFLKTFFFQPSEKCNNHSQRLSGHTKTGDKW